MLIRIISGNYGLQVGASIKVKTPADKPFEVNEQEALRLQKLGVAEICEKGFEGKVENNIEGDPEDDPEGLREHDPEDNSPLEEIPTYSADNTNAELQALAEKYDIDVPSHATKAQLLELLDNYFSELPVLSAEEPQ